MAGQAAAASNAPLLSYTRMSPFLFLVCLYAGMFAWLVCVLPNDGVPVAAVLKQLAPMQAHGLVHMSSFKWPPCKTSHRLFRHAHAGASVAWEWELHHTDRKWGRHVMYFFADVHHLDCALYAIRGM